MQVVSQWIRVLSRVYHRFCLSKYTFLSASLKEEGNETSDDIQNTRCTYLSCHSQ
jgi:hypothetical protein